MRTRIPLLALMASSLVSAQPVSAQTPPSAADMTIDAATRTAVIDGALEALRAFYVYPDVAAKMADAIPQRQQQREYDAIASARTFADKLTSDLQAVSHDKHLRVGYSAEVLPPMAMPQGPPPPAALERMRAALSQVNFGFERVERLAGNVGYLDLRAFAPPAVMGDTAAAAMTFLANADALIIDLRQNGGGSPDGVALVATYLFGADPVRLNDIYDRPSDETRQFRTLPYVPGKRFVDKDVYVLTSARTFSAAEDFTYAVKNLKRATIVGEVTGGGAHPGGPHRLTDHFMIGVPAGRSISSVTHTDWEGVGVEPDIKVAADKALATAHLKALEKRAATADPRFKREIDTAIERLKKELSGSQG